MSRTLKQTRSKMGLSLANLAQLTGIGRSTLGNYETGRATMSPDKVRQLASCLKLDIEDVLPGASLLPAIASSETAPTLPAACRIPAECDLPARLAAIEKEMGDIRKLLISLLAAERSREASGAGAGVRDDKRSDE